MNGKFLLEAGAVDHVVVKNGMGERGAVSVQALTEISVQTESSGTLRGHSVQVDTRLDYPDSDRTSSPKRRPTPLDIGQSPYLKADASTLQVVPGPPKSPKVLYSPISPCVSPSKSLEYLSYEKSLGDTSPQRICSATDLSKGPPTSPRAPKVIQRSMSDPKPMSPTAEERAAGNFQYSEGYSVSIQYFFTVFKFCEDSSLENVLKCYVLFTCFLHNCLIIYYLKCIMPWGRFIRLFLCNIFMLLFSLHWLSLFCFSNVAPAW